MVTYFRCRTATALHERALIRALFITERNLRDKPLRNCVLNDYKAHDFDGDHRRLVYRVITFGAGLEPLWKSVSVSHTDRKSDGRQLFS